MTLSPGESEIVAVVAGSALAAVVALALARKGRTSTPRYPRLTVAVAMVIAFTCYAGVALRKLDGYNMGAEDLGRIDQAIWSVLSGQPLVFSASELGRPMSRMAGHVELLYIALAPLLLLRDDASILLIAQAAAVALGAVPAFRLGRRLGSPGLGVAAALAYLAHPAVNDAVLADIHGDTFAMPLLLLALERAHAGRDGQSFVAMALAVSGKEYVAALAVSTGLWFAFAWGRRRLGAACIALGLVWVLVVVPATHRRFRPPDFPQMTKIYYEGLGSTPKEVVVNSLRHPDRVLRLALHPRKLGVAAMLVAPLAFAPLAAPVALSLCAPVLVPLIVSDHFNTRNHHNATLVPFLLLAAILGARRVAGHNAAVVLVAAAAVSHFTVAPTPLSARSWTPGRWAYLGNPHIAGHTPHHEVLDAAMAQVGAAARVSASPHLGAHLSHREVCFSFPAGLAQADVAIVDLVGSYPPAFHPRARELEALTDLLRSPDWGVVMARDGVFVLRRGARSDWRALSTCGSPMTAPARVAVGPLILESTADGRPSWSASRRLETPILVLDAATRQVLPGPSAPLSPAPWPRGQSIEDATGCWPPPGSRLLVVQLHEGFPADLAFEPEPPPRPWLPDAALGERLLPAPPGEVMTR